MSLPTVEVTRKPRATRRGKGAMLAEYASKLTHEELCAFCVEFTKSSPRSAEFVREELASAVEETAMQRVVQ